MVLSLALKMCAEQDTELEVLLRPRRRRRTEFLRRLGRRACREAVRCLFVEVAKGANFNCVLGLIETQCFEVVEEG